MARHKQMPGETYRIVGQDNSSATVEFSYLCPYCMNHTTVTKTYYSDFNLLETGLFYDALECGECGKTTDVRFVKANRI